MAIKDELFQSTLENLYRILGLLKQPDKDRHIIAAEKTIDEAYQKFTGAEAILFKSLGSEELIDILSTNDILDREKAYVLGVLFKADSELQAAMANPKSISLKFKALDLLIEAALELDVDNANPYIEELKEELADYELSTKSKWRLFNYDWVWGNFAEAEDRLFGLLEEFGANSEIELQAKEFYTDLREKEKQELIKGNLPFEELDEGQKAFEERFLELKSG